MPKADSSLNMLIVAAVLALGVGYYVPRTFSSRPVETTGATAVVATDPKPVPPKKVWAASAPGRIEPIGGEVKIGAQVPGRIAEVLVAPNDKVKAGDLLIRLDEDDLVARANAAAAEAAARKRDRDNESVNRAAQDRRSAEDNAANAESQLVAARAELDRLLTQRHRGQGGSDDEVAKARDAVAKASERLEQARTTLRKLPSSGEPAQARLEAALAAARAQVSVVETAIEHTRIRAPSDGTILQVNAKAGEIVTPSPENVLLVIGNVSSLRVRAEFEERDVGKVHVGQSAVVRSDAFPGKDFMGKVALLGQSLGPSRIGQRGPRKPTDVDVFEVLIDLTDHPPLLPGMRVDVFLSEDSQPGASTGGTGAAAKAN
jgi:HlyD family secretion protein